MARALAVDPASRLTALLGPKPRVAVAFSGGVDSTVLAHALMRARHRLGSLRLVHVDHGLQAASAKWSRHCARIARRWRVPFKNLRVKVSADGASLEGAARDARYDALGHELGEGEVLVMAHHLDDQAETFLLQLFRGAGVAGLASMPAVRRFASGWLARPLLDTPRADVIAYARQHRLTWVDDPTNQLLRHDRNLLRHEVLPKLRARWPAVDAAIARSARHAAEAAGLLEARAAADAVAVADGNGLNVAALRRLDLARRRNVLRWFLARAAVEPPSTAKMREISGPLLEARRDAQPEVEWQGAVLRRRAGRLELAPRRVKAEEATAETALKSWSWSEERQCRLSNGDTLLLVDDAAGPIDLDKLPVALHLRSRHGGESLRPGVRARTQSLKKLLQSAKLTLEQRSRLPLLFGEGPKGRLLAVGDRWLDASVMANVKSRRRARLIWKRNE